jgi:hypothetical protein
MCRAATITARLSRPQVINVGNRRASAYAFRLVLISSLAIWICNLKRSSRGAVCPVAEIEDPLWKSTSELSIPKSENTDRQGDRLCVIRAAAYVAKANKVKNYREKRMYR